MLGIALLGSGATAAIQAAGWPFRTLRLVFGAYQPVATGQPVPV